MNAEIGRTGRDLLDASCREEEKIEEEMTPTSDAVSTFDNILTKLAPPLSDTSLQSRPSDDSSSGDMQHFSKPSLSYIALIAKVILSSPSQKLNLASIYRAMEEQFSHLKSRGPGWRNSVRHNLSVNSCFVKVSRCEDGRGHYWGVHQAHLRDFQQGNFRQSRRPRGRREMERFDGVPRCLTWMETDCFGSQYYESGSLTCMEPQCPLQEPMRYQRSLLDWLETHYNPWSVNMSWEDTSSWMGCYYCPERLPDSYSRPLAALPLNSRLPCWAMNYPLLTDMTYDSRIVTPPLQLPPFQRSWCVSPVTEFLKPLP